ncbi:MAG TPA: tRNA (adenosine(37)-N6)-threonylcarbamoyltransferase complex transferase subunit TsaD [Bacillota bacterium]
MLCLGIETSCDETSVAVVEDGRFIRANIVSSQRGLHRRYGGVVPELASRRHVEALLPALEEALAEAGVTAADVDLIAVTRGPGLLGSLLVGVVAAKTLAYAYGRPLVGVHHLAGHIHANFLSGHRPRWPAVCLIVSGGHTDLVWLPGDGSVERLGGTRDDAAGEAFDKVARLLGLGYPGGPRIDALARQGDPAAIALPRALMDDPSYDFSYSGLKTAVAQLVERYRSAGRPLPLADLCASFQQAAIEPLVFKTLRAAVERGARSILLAGGVAANSALRAELERRATAAGLEVHAPPLELCTDNAAMIAAAGTYAYRDQGRSDDLELEAAARLPLERL